MVPTPLRHGSDLDSPEYRPAPSHTNFFSILHGPGRAACLASILALLPIGAARADVVTYTSIDVPKAIPDNNPVGITSELIVPDSIVIVDVDLIFNELLHESVSDLRIELTSPSGTTAVLVKAASEGGILMGLGVRDNFVGTIFDDQAPTNLRDAYFDNHVGSYNIDHASVDESPLSVFNGEDAMGTWHLHISDRARRDTGDLILWSLRFTNAEVAPPSVPEPTGAVLLGLGLGCAVIAGRMRPRS